MQKKQEKTRKQIAKHNRNLSNVAMYKFSNMLKYKSQWGNTEILKTGAFQSTTTICSACGYKLPYKLDTNIRKWTCPNCKAEHDRDRNASKVIKLICLGHLPKC